MSRGKCLGSGHMLEVPVHLLHSCMHPCYHIFLKFSIDSLLVYRLENCMTLSMYKETVWFSVTPYLFSVATTLSTCNLHFHTGLKPSSKKKLRSTSSLRERDNFFLVRMTPKKTL